MDAAVICPFCRKGNEIKTDFNLDDGWTARCENCFAQGPLCDSEYEALAAFGKPALQILRVGDVGLPMTEGSSIRYTSEPQPILGNFCVCVEFMFQNGALQFTNFFFYEKYRIVPIDEVARRIRKEHGGG